MLTRVLLLAVIPLVLFAGNSSKRAVAVRTMDAPRIDGRLDEPAWQLAKPETEFWQQNPAEGEPATQRTEVRFLYDGDALYVSCMMYDRDPSKIVARLARRDDEVVSDWISIRIDSYHDHQTAFEFTVNAAGVKTDIIQFSDGAEEDDSWDAVWDVETAITDQGWIAEYKIPFQALRFSGEETKEWGLQIVRHIARDSEVQHWALIRRSESGWVSRFGHLTGIENIAPPSGVQIIPYGVASGRFLPKSPSHPAGREFATDAGFDLKYQHGSGLTIDATFNPDFGQV
ncbi:MAG: sugar-binding protein, partial [Bacteroidota bacterium]